MNVREELAEEIRAAWADAVYPGDENIGREDALVFVGRDWRTIPLHLIRYLRDELVEFDPEALAYYLPAFLLATIFQTDEVDTLIESLPSYLSPWKQTPRPYDSWADEWRQKVADSLTPGQARVVAAFFQNYLEIMGEDYWNTDDDDTTREAAVGFWMARVNDPRPGKAIVPIARAQPAYLNNALRLELTNRLRQVFDTMPYPGNERIGDIPLAGEHFTDWRSLPLGTLHWVIRYIWEDYLDRLTPEGFCFFLPAFMAATLTYSEFLLDFIPTGLMNVLCGAAATAEQLDWRRQVASLLSFEQKRAIAEYLRSFADIVPGAYRRQTETYQQNYARQIEFWTRLAE